MNELWHFKKITSEVEVKMEAEVKSRSDLNRELVDLLPQKKFGVLALKMNKEWLFKIFDLGKMNKLWPLKFLFSKVEVKMEAEVKIEVRFK